MLIFSDEKILPYIELDNVKVYNLSNPRQYGIPLNSLIVPPFYNMDSKDFDLIYANYIMQNDIVFVEFMNIIYNVYEGYDVIVLVGENEYRECITESLIKLIQQRYGYNPYRVNSPEDDLDLVKDSEFSIQGLYNLDIDKERYTYLTTNFYQLQKELGISNE